MGRTVEFHYDIVCPYAYIASRRIESIAERNAVSVIWHPVLLGGVYDLVNAPQGKDGSAMSLMNAQKQAVASADLLLAVARYGIRLNYHPRHPVRSVDALRLLHSIGDNGARARLTHALFRAYWVDNLDVSDRAVLLDMARAHGVAASADCFDNPAVKRRLREATQRTVDLGLPGVPGFVVSPDGIFFGQDRLHFVDRALGNTAAAQFRARLGLAPRPTVLTFYHDFSSPWSYIGSTQIERVAREAGPNVTIEVVPILLGAVFKEIGTPNVPMMAMSEAKRAYAAKDMQDWLAWWGGIPLSFPSSFPIRSVLPLRVSIVAPQAMHAIYAAAWVRDRDISDRDVLHAILVEAGQSAASAEATLRAADSDAVKEQLKANTARAIAGGVCGVPSFQVNGGQVVWGQDRLDVVADMLAGWTPTPSPRM